MENERKDIRTLARHMALANDIKIVGEEPYAENLHVRFCEGQADSNHSHYDILTQYKMEREGMSSLVYSTYE